jgi:uncharacterized membrane protein YhaH (DUF805 family)
MIFEEAIASGLARTFDYTGRSSRHEYWFLVLFLILIQWLLGLLVRYVGFVQGWSAEGLDLVATFLSVAASLPHISVSARRLHDVNLSGWWQLIALTIIGVIPLLYFNCKRGNTHKNRFGEGPLGSPVVPDTPLEQVSQERHVATPTSLTKMEVDAVSRSPEVAIEATGPAYLAERADEPLMEDDDLVFYEQALGELEDDKKHKGIWAKAFAESEGDEEAKKSYIRMRVRNLNGEKIAQEEAKQAALEEKERARRNKNLVAENALKERQRAEVKQPSGEKVMLDKLSDLQDYFDELP